MAGVPVALSCSRGEPMSAKWCRTGFTQANEVFSTAQYVVSAVGKA